jgi:retron-type reverse transcriptase
MGKKYKHLYQDIYSFENLWRASRKARRGKRLKEQAAEFEYDLENRLLEIQTALKNENYTFGDYTFFSVHEPRERCIAAAPYADRVLHHALCNLIEPVLDRAMIYDSYACRVGKGSHRALQRAQEFLRRNDWVLKLDIKKYFFTIDHEILLRDLARKISDHRVLTFIQKILATYQSPVEYYSLFETPETNNPKRLMGLPIGNLTSQLFANYYLTSMDRFIKEQLKFKHYLRYMDDALLFANSKTELLESKEQIKELLEKRRLKLHQQKSQVFPAKNGVRFLGFHLYRNRKKILRPNLQRFKKRMKRKSWQYEREDIYWENVLLSLNAWMGFADKRENRRFINEVLFAIKFRHPDSGQNFKFWIPA